MNSISIIEKPPERLNHAEIATDPGAPEQLRRTRGTNPAKRSETPKMKSNGHDTSTARVNGHGPASPSQSAHEHVTPVETDRAASDDTRDFPAAAAASSAPAGKERDACAEVAPSAEGATALRPAKNGSRSGTGKPCVPSDKKTGKINPPGSTTSDGTSGRESTMVRIPGGSEPLPTDGVGFVDAMHAHVDLYQACARLVKSKDEKIAQRMVERLLEMSYGKGPAPTGDEAPQIIFDAPRPIRD